jgi:carboxymethylenebutenolidase
MKRALICLAVLSLTTVANGQDWAKAALEKSPRHHEYVKVKNGSREVNCFVAYPEVKEKATAVLVIHEIFGLADWPKLLADELAEAGYIAIAPDLLSGAGPDGGGTDKISGRDGVMKAIRDLPADQITGDLDAAAKYVTALDSSNGKLAVCGFCWGGGQAFRYASKNPSVKAAFPFYGSTELSAAEVAAVGGPVYGFYGGNDNRINASIPKSTDQMKAAGKAYEPVIYETGGHGFMRGGEPSNPEAREGDKKAREEAWIRLKDILKRL